MFALNVLAQSNSGGVGDFIGVLIAGVVMLAFTVLLIASMWKIFTKAGQPGWAAIIPIYNIYILLQIIERPVWWLFLFFVPLVNTILVFIIYIELAQAFGKDILYGLGLIFLSFIFLPMLGFGNSRYQGAQPLF